MCCLPGDSSCPCVICMIQGFVFVSFLFLSSVIKFDKKCAFLQRQKFTLQDEVIYQKSSRITFQPRYANLLSSKITQHDIKVHKGWKYLGKILFQRKLIETNNIFTIRGKKIFLFQLRACKQEMQLNKFLTVHIKPFSTWNLDCK